MVKCEGPAQHKKCGKFMSKEGTTGGKPYWYCETCDILVQNMDSIRFINE